MIYMFGSGSFKNGEKAVKIGFTENKDERESAYFLHNPLGQFLGWREGDKKLELKLHLRLKDFKETFLDEWFYYEPPVLDIFNETEEQINEWLWKNKDDIFYSPTLPTFGSLKWEIFMELREIFDNKNKPVLGIKTLSMDEI